MKMTTLYAALSGALLLGTAALSPAQQPSTTTGSSKADSAVHSTRDKADKATSGGAKEGISRDEYKKEKDRIEADAKSAKEKCKSMSGNAKDVCEAEAKATEKVAKKELDYKNKPTDKNKNDLEKIKVEAAYEVAKEKCDDQKGAEMASCKKQAKAEKDRQMAALRGGDRKNVASKDASGSGAAGRTGSTAGNTGGSASGTAGMSSGNTSSSMSPGGTPSSTTSNTTTSGTSTGAAGSASKSSAGTTGATGSSQDKSGK